MKVIINNLKYFMDLQRFVDRNHGCIMRMKQDEDGLTIKFNIGDFEYCIFNVKCLKKVFLNVVQEYKEYKEYNK